MTLKRTIKGIAKKLVVKKQTLGIAESCTGGLICAHLTEIPGASAFFSGGLVTYANHTKQDLLGVSLRALNTQGAVSKDVALQMAKGARKILGTHWTISVTGIAGPSGGTPAKPVGLVFYSVMGPKIVVVKKKLFKGNRRTIQRKTTKLVLEHLLRLLDS